MPIKKIFLIITGSFLIFSNAAAHWTDTCSHLKTWAYIKPGNEAEYQRQYDTLKMFIEHCAASDSLSWKVFTTLTGAVQFKSGDSTRFDEYRNWLIKVLYYNTTVPEYFCTCMEAIIRTFQYGKYKDIGGFTIQDYLRKFHRNCLGANEDQVYTKDSLYLVQEGLDPSKLPSLDSLGLGFLLGQNSVADNEIPIKVSSFPNPFHNKLRIDFTLKHVYSIKIEIYDELGKNVWNSQKDWALETGLHSINIDSQNFPTGILYARISANSGEVATVKLVHEK